MATLLRISRTAVASGLRYFHKSGTNIGVLGAPLQKGQPKPGVELAPMHIRESGILSDLQNLGHNVHDYGDLQFERYENDAHKADGDIVIPNTRNVGAACKKISEKVADIVSKGQIALTLGGDHSLAIGTVHGHAQAEPDMCLVWVDAHADLNPPCESLSGNLHGIVLSLLLHETQHLVPRMKGLEWITPCLHAKDVAYIALRDVDPAEKRIIKDNNITCFTMHDVDKLGISAVLKKAIDAINPKKDKPIHLSYDIDSLDPAIAPSTGTKVAGGLTMREGLYVAHELAATGMLKGVDLVEVNTQLGNQEENSLTLAAAGRIIGACFGQRSW